MSGNKAGTAGKKSPAPKKKGGSGSYLDRILKGLKGES